MEEELSVQETQSAYNIALRTSLLGPSIELTPQYEGDEPEEITTSAFKSRLYSTQYKHKVRDLDAEKERKYTDSIGYRIGSMDLKQPQNTYQTKSKPFLSLGTSGFTYTDILSEEQKREYGAMDSYSEILTRDAQGMAFRAKMLYNTGPWSLYGPKVQQLHPELLIKEPVEEAWRKDSWHIFDVLFNTPSEVFNIPNIVAFEEGEFRKAEPNWDRAKVMKDIEAYDPDAWKFLQVLPTFMDLYSARNSLEFNYMINKGIAINALQQDQQVRQTIHTSGQRMMHEAENLFIGTLKSGDFAAELAFAGLTLGTGAVVAGVGAAVTIPYHLARLTSMAARVESMRRMHNIGNNIMRTGSIIGGVTKWIPHRIPSTLTHMAIPGTKNAWAKLPLWLGITATEGAIEEGATSVIDQNWRMSPLTGARQRYFSWDEVGITTVYGAIMEPVLGGVFNTAFKGMGYASKGIFTGTTFVTSAGLRGINKKGLADSLDAFKKLWGAYNINYNIGIHGGINPSLVPFPEDAFRSMVILEATLNDVTGNTMGPILIEEGDTKTNKEEETESAWDVLTQWATLARVDAETNTDNGLDSAQDDMLKFAKKIHEGITNLRERMGNMSPEERVYFLKAEFAMSDGDFAQVFGNTPDGLSQVESLRITNDFLIAYTAFLMKASAADVSRMSGVDKLKALNVFMFEFFSIRAEQKKVKETKSGITKEDQVTSEEEDDFQERVSIAQENTRQFLRILEALHAKESERQGKGGMALTTLDEVIRSMNSIPIGTTEVEDTKVEPEAAPVEPEAAPVELKFENFRATPDETGKTTPEGRPQITLDVTKLDSITLAAISEVLPDFEKLKKKCQS